MNRCLSCFKEYSEEFEVCPFCGALKEPEPNEPIHLQPGTILANRYLIGLSVGVGGFGIVYRAWDMKLGAPIAVKEFYVGRLSIRTPGQKTITANGKSREEYEYRKARFLAEARCMAQFGSHKNIPNVYEYFEENNTAYIVMEILEGEVLSNYMRDNRGKIDMEFAVYITNEVGKALMSLHEKGIIHRDVAPDNIFICNDKEIKIKLLDLGAARLIDSTDEIIDIILKPGYSPIEQYDKTQNIGPYTDIYALGATLYYMLTGIKPDESTNRKINDSVIPPHELNKNIPGNISNAVMKSLAVYKHLRFKNIKEFLKAINGEKKVGTVEQEKKHRKRIRFSGAAAACLAIAVCAFFAFRAYQHEKSETILKDAEISIWFSVEDESDEQKAMKAVSKMFRDKFPNIKISLVAIPQKEYSFKISAAAKKGELPDLFESTYISNRAVDAARDLDDVIESEQAKNCLFIDQYDNYYANRKKMPLAIEIPVAYLITSGNVSTDWSSEYFTKLGAFGDVPVSADDRCLDLLCGAFGSGFLEKVDTGTYLGRNTFLNNQQNTAAVLISSSMAFNEVRETLTQYQKVYAFYDADRIPCRFTYEWSIGAKEENKYEAAKTLLTWMLGNVYQNTLMISECQDGQIPINKICFNEKTQQKYLLPVRDICDKFVFDGE